AFATSQVVLAGGGSAMLQFTNSDGTANPDELTISQDATIDGDNVPVAAQLFDGTTALDQLTLRSFDKDVQLTGVNLALSDELTLSAKEDINFTGSTLNVESSLNLEVFDAFAVSSTLASEINAASVAHPIDLSITAGALGTLTNTDEAGLSIDAHLTLTSSASMLLRGGAGGAGDLAFNGASTPILTADAITLWAGNGGSSGSRVVAVDADGVEQVRFDNMGSALTAFMLRQSASITDATIPNAAQFLSNIDGMNYALRSDAGGIGGVDAIDNSKLEKTFLSIHALGTIDPVFTGGSLEVRGLDIGGLDSFAYTRDLNNTFDIVDFDDTNMVNNDTVLVIRAGMSGTGDLSFDGSLDGSETDTSFNIDADEIRLVAGDGLAGKIESRVILDNDAAAENRPTFRGAGGDTMPVTTFVFRQDDAIAQNNLPLIDKFFNGVAPDIYVVHSDHDASLLFAPPPSILITDFDNLPLATGRLILSGEHVTIARDDNLDLVSDFAQGNASFNLEIRANTIELRADDLLDTEGSVPLSISLYDSASEMVPTFTDFERSQDDDASELFTPALIDFASSPATTPIAILLSQEADITKDVLEEIRDSLGAPLLTTHDDPDDDSALRLELDTFEGNVELNSAAQYVEFMDLRIVLRADDAMIDWNQDANPTTYSLANLVINANHSFVIGDAASLNDLEIVSETGIEINAGNAGSDGDLSFGQLVILTANAIKLRAGVDGQLAGNGETPTVDVTTNLPTFNFVDTADPGDLPDSVFEIRQDAGFVDNMGIAMNGESLIAGLIQIQGQDEIGTLRLVSDAGNITITDLAATFVPYFPGTAGSVAQLELTAGAADPLGQGTVTIQDVTATDTDLTAYDSVDITADEIILAANGSGIVRASDLDVIFHKGESGPALDPLRFTIRHDSADICEGAVDCAMASLDALPDLSQFDLRSSFPLLHYTLESIAGYVELTTQIASKMLVGSGPFLQGVDLTLLGKGGGDFDVKISADPSIRDADIQLNSLVIGKVNDPLSIRITDVHLATITDQTYYGTVEIEDTAELTGDTLHFTEDISALMAGKDEDLTLNVREHLRIDGDIDLLTAGTLRINLDPTSADFPRVEFGGDGAMQMVRADSVEIFATPEADLDGFSGEIPVTERASTTATIGKRSGDLVFDVNKFAMSEGEKLSVGGALTIGKPGALEALIGDLSAVTIDVIAARIAIVLRSAGRYLGLDGSLASDAGVDLVANTIHLNGAIELIGSGKTASFGLLNPYTADANLASFPVAGLNANNRAIAAADFDWTLADAPPDLHPTGATRDDFSSVFFGKEIVPAPTAWRAEPFMPSDEALLARLEIEARTDSPRAIHGRLDGAGIIDDVGSDLPDRSSDRVTVSVSRVLARDAEAVADRFDRLFGKDGNRAEHVRQALQAALDDYLATSTTHRVLGFEFRRYLRNRPNSQFDAYQALEDLDRLFSYHRNLGLTSGEYKRIQRRWLQDIKPDGISLEQLAEAIHPTRFVRGSDILELFGD
ncbi:MAG: hypothetical protein IH973_07090, partial [Myxococcales bacterium]|nr:hypothetical protein [Myxococcales bacterium]